MNKYHVNVYERIMDIMNLLFEADGISVEELSQKYNIAADIILNDLRYLHDEGEELGVYICQSDCDDENDDEINGENFLNDLWQGKYNDVPLYADKIRDDSIFSLQLSVFEKVFLKDFLSKDAKRREFKGTNDIWMKNPPSDMSFGKLDILEQMNEAICYKTAVRIDYRVGNKKEKKELLPIKIVRMISTGICYCMV